VSKLFQPLLLLLATATDRELARMVEYLKAENRVLRGKLPKRIEVTPQEKRRLVKLGRRLGGKLRELITIVSPRTFLRWLHDEDRPRKRPRRGAGRPRTPEEVRELVLRLARENAWGYTEFRPQYPPLRFT
jgi:putative transposase